MEEEWRDVVGYEGLYKVSNLGRVKRLAGSCRCVKDRILVQQQNHRGYMHCDLSINNKIKTWSVHKIVALAFVYNDNPTEKTEVNHLNEIITDNRAENLSWVTRAENCNYGTRNLRIAKKKSKPVNQFTLDGQLVRTWKSAKETETSGFVQCSVTNCCKGKRKSHKGFVWRYA